MKFSTVWVGCLKTDRLDFSNSRKNPDLQLLQILPNRRFFAVKKLPQGCVVAEEGGGFLRATGRGAGSNPASRFLAIIRENDFEQLEFDEEFCEGLKRPKTVYLEDRSKSVISENDSPDIPFRYSLNPYRGCLHGCSYCYARPTHEYLGLSAGLDFETRIFVKRDAPDLFRDFLGRSSWVCESIMMSGVTDCYQPIERQLELTRGCLRVALEASQPVALITKNALILRDLDLLSELAGRGLCRVAISLNSLDQSLTKVLEPACSAPAARLDAMRKLSTAGVPVHLMAAPVIPGLNDAELPAVLRAAADAGVKSAGYIMVRLPLTVEPLFREWLQQQRPLMAEKVETRLRLVRGGQLSSGTFHERMRGTGEYAEHVGALFRLHRRKCGLETQLPPLRTDLFRPPRSSGGQQFLF
jgi:DNA repair photolyase